MCTKEYLAQRYSDTMSLILRTVDHAVDGTDPHNGGCFIGQMEEVTHIVPVLSGLASLLGTIIARQRHVSVEDGKQEAREVILDRLVERGGLPSAGTMPDDLFDLFKSRMN